MSTPCLLVVGDWLGNLRPLYSRFMWVDLQIKYLCTLGTKDAIKRKLGKLPKTLEETYAKIYEAILGEDAEELEVAKRALMWVMCSRRPLSSEEWASFSYWPEPADQDTGAYPLLKMCHNLVTVDNQMQVVRFAHLSVQEYLEKLDDFTAEKANSMAARFCLSVLLSDEMPIPSLLRESFGYSRGYWVEHASQCTGSQCISKLLRSFLGTAAEPGRAYCDWHRYSLKRNLDPADLSSSASSSTCGFDHQPENINHLYSEPVNPVFAVCCFRLGTGFQDFWDWDAFDIDSRNAHGETLLHVASLVGNEQLVKSLLENGADVNTPRWESWSEFENPLTTAITECQARIVVTLLDHGGSVGFPGVGLYRNTLEFAAEHGDVNVVEAIIDRDCNTKVTEKILVAAARNEYHYHEVLETLLARDPAIRVTEDVLLAALENTFNSEGRLEFLLARDSTIQITEAVLSAAAGKRSNKALEMLLARDPTLQITEAIWLTTARRHNGSPLESDSEGIEVVETVSRPTRNSSEKVLEMLLAGDHTIQITEAVLSAAAWNSNEKALEMLLASDHTIRITEAVLSKAAANEDEKALEILLASYHTIQITEAVLSAAACNSNEKALEMLLAGDHSIQVTEAVLLAAAGNQNEKALEILLASDHTIQITEYVLLTAAWNSNERAMEILLASDHTIQITEDVLSVAAENQNEKALGILLASDHTTQVTEAVLSAAAENENEKALEILLANDHTIQITEAVLSAAARGCNEKTLKILLAHDRTIRITEVVLSAAVEGFDPAIALVVIFASENNIEITEAILTAAAGKNEFSEFVKVLEVLARNAGNTNVTVNPTALEASAYFASSFLFHRFLGKCDRSSISSGKYPQIIYAAVQGGDGNILRLLLELGGGECLEPDEHGWTLQMVERQSDFVNEALPSRASNRTHHRSEPPKQLEAGIGHCAQIQMSEPTALDISRLPECIKLQSDGSYMFYSGGGPILLSALPCVLIVEGMSNKLHSAHTVKANHPFPPGYLGLNYFEVIILKCSETRYAVIGEGRRI